MENKMKISSNRADSKKSIGSKELILRSNLAMKKLVLNALSRAERVKVSDLYLEYCESRFRPITRPEFVRRLQEANPDLHFKYYSEDGEKCLYVEKVPHSCEKEPESNDIDSI